MDYDDLLLLSQLQNGNYGQKYCYDSRKLLFYRIQIKKTPQLPRVDQQDLEEFFGSIFFRDK